MEKKPNRVRSGMLARMLCVILLLGLLSACGTSGTSPQPAATSTEDPQLKEIADVFPFDPDEMPEDIGEVIYVAGSWYDMGYQYGVQAGDIIARSYVNTIPKLEATCGSRDAVYAQTQTYLEALKNRSQELYDLICGMADGAQQELLNTAIGAVFCLSNYEPSCSTVSAWGEATEKGTVLAAVNGDGSWGAKCYFPALVAFPENGHAFMSFRGFFTNCMVNDAGLVAMTSLGQSALEEDSGVGSTGMTTCMEVMWQCATAEEAKELFLKGGIAPLSGENFHCVDEKGNAFIIEHTAARDVVRQSGDHGETGYLIANNHYVDESMQDSLWGWPDCWPRYWTVEEILKSDMGSITLETMDRALSSDKYYADGVWSEHSREPGKEDWSPENFGVTYKTHTRGLVDVASRTLYRQNGGTNTLNNYCPDTTGNFSKLTLGANIAAVNSTAQMDAYQMIFYAQAEMDEAGITDPEKLENLNFAKRCLISGLSYTDLAAFETDTTESIQLYSQATSNFCRAQRYAQLVIEDSAHYIYAE